MALCHHKRTAASGAVNASSNLAGANYIYRGAQMRHAKAGDLAGIAPLLGKIRRIKEIRERGTAHLYFKGRSAIHFHVDESGCVYADIGDARMQVKGAHTRIMKTLADYVRRINGTKRE